MGLNNLGLGFLFTAKDAASGTINQVRTNFAKAAGATTEQANAMNTAFASVTSGLALVGAGLGGLTGAANLAGQFGKFEQSLAAVRGVTKATDEQMRMLTDAAIQAGAATQFSPDDATQGLLSLATAGQTAEQATKTLLPVLDLAAGSLGQLGVAESAEAVVGTLNAYGIAAEEATGVTDRLLRVTQLTNFQTKDFESGLAKAAAAGATFNQGLNDVLITMGLLRNRNIDASSSATAFREATRRLGSDQRAQQAVTEQGVDIFDKQTGEMRSIVDVISDFAAVTKDLTAEERQNAVATAFGARGLLAFNAVAGATFTKTLPDGTTQLLKGTDAIEALRSEMDNASGTAEGFKTTLLDTFEGQKTLVGGLLETFQIVSGKEFATLFRPIVEAFAFGLSNMIKIIQSMPTPLKRFISGLFLLTSAFATVAGGLLFFKGTALLLAPIMGLVVQSLLAALAVFVPFIGILATAALMVKGLKIAADQGLLPFLSTTTNTLDKIKLAWESFMQFFSDGAISGPIADELLLAENEGIRRFVFTAIEYFDDFRNFFAGIMRGFKEQIEFARPALRDFEFAISTLLGTVKMLFSDGDPSSLTERYNEFGSAGEGFGRKLGKAFEIFVKGATLAVEFTVLLVDAAIAAWGWIDRVGKVVALAGLGFGVQYAIGAIAASVATAGFSATMTGLALSAASAVSALAPFLFAFGQVLIVGAAVWGIFNFVVESVRGMGRVFSEVGNVIASFGNDQIDTAEALERLWYEVVVSILRAIGGLAEGVVAAGDLIAGVFGVETGFAKGVRDSVAIIEREIDDKLRPKIEYSTTPTGGAPAAAGSAAVAGPAVGAAAVEVAAANRAASADDIQAIMDRAMASVAKSIQAQPIQNVVQIDGETVATNVANRLGESAETSFTPGGGLAPG